MRFAPTLILAVLAACCLHSNDAQFNGMGRFFGNFGHMFMPMFRPFQAMFGGFQQRPNSAANSAGISGGTDAPQATGRDELNPADCGRDKKTGKGSLCFPDGLLCEQRVSRVGTQRFGNHYYWVSWLSNEPRLANYKWDWFNARNYCRKRCMDLVSIETREENEFLKSLMNGANIPGFWTSGRLCDFDGCDRADLLPKNINGWFWSGSSARMVATNSQHEFHDWSQVGRLGLPQPDNSDGGESCMAVMNNAFQDGVKWHDLNCLREVPIVCEDVEGHLAYARQQFPNIRIP